jgi:hypothetical protein
MSNAIQYTYGVIGASESSTTIAIDCVSLGAPLQLIGGLTARGAAQVYLLGIVPRTNDELDTVITLGAMGVTPEPSSPHPASATAAPRPLQAAIIRRAPRFTPPILGPEPGAGVLTVTGGG